ncbi:MAG TPA: DNA polymerase III subunit delta [Thermoanaerobaculia bacterium]|nr:DNA polymerase III subunit delta [Thermoanaerobaculia bacterium]
MTQIQADAFLSDPPARVLAAAAILIAGDERYLVDKVLAAVLERVVTAPGADQFDLERRDAADLSPADFESIVSTMPFVNERRVIVLRNVPELPADTRDRVKTLLESEPRGLCLIGTGGSSMRGNLYQIWEKHGARVVCELPKKSPRSKQVDFDFARWLEGHARADFGKTLEPAAAAALAELAGELQPLYAELEKVAMYVGDADTITLADVEAVCSGGAIGTVWEWCDAVGGRDTGRALTLLEELLVAGESAYRLVPLLATHFCRLGIVVRLPSKDPKAIMEALPGRSWYGMAKGLAEQSRRHTPESIDRALDLLAAADLMLKSTSHDEKFVLHRHLLEILENAA